MPTEADGRPESRTIGQHTAYARVGKSAAAPRGGVSADAALACTPTPPVEVASPTRGACDVDEEEHGDVGVGALGARQRLGEAVDEEQAVGEIGEGVVQRLVRGRIERVQRLRPVDGEGEDAAGGVGVLQARSHLVPTVAQSRQMP